MFPITVTVHNDAQLLAVMAALGYATPDGKPSKPESVAVTTAPSQAAKTESIQPAPAAEAPKEETPDQIYASTAQVLSKLAARDRKAALAILQKRGKAKLTEIPAGEYPAIRTELTAALASITVQ